MMNLYQVAEEISRRLASIFLRDKEGRRPVYGGTQKFQDDPHWRDYLLFYEYFHGDNGAGLGASHQTGWTGHHRPEHAPVRDHHARAGPRTRQGRRDHGSGAGAAWAEPRASPQPQALTCGRGSRAEPPRPVPRPGWGGRG